MRVIPSLIPLKSLKNKVRAEKIITDKTEVHFKSDLVNDIIIEFYSLLMEPLVYFLKIVKI